MKRLLFIISLVSLAYFFSSNVQDPVSTLIDENVEYHLDEDALDALVIQMNSSFPYMVDQQTNLLSVSANNSVFSYRYEMINYAVGDIDSNSFAAEMRQSLLKRSCDDEGTIDLLKRQVVVSHRYYGQGNVDILAQVDIAPADCNL